MASRAAMDLAVGVTHLVVRFQIIRADRHLAVSAGDVEHVGWPCQPGDTPAQCGEQAAAFLDRHMEA